MEPAEQSTSKPTSHTYNPKHSVISFLEPPPPPRSLHNTQRDESPHSHKRPPNALLSVIPCSERRLGGDSPLSSPLSGSSSPTVADYPSDREACQETGETKGKNAASLAKPKYVYTPYRKSIEHGADKGSRRSWHELEKLNEQPDNRTAYRDLFKEEFLRWQAETKQFNFSMEPSVPDALSDKAKELGIPLSDLTFQDMSLSPDMAYPSPAASSPSELLPLRSTTPLPASPSSATLHLDNSSHQCLSSCPDYMSVQSAPSLRTAPRRTMTSGKNSKKTLLRKRRPSVPEMNSPKVTVPEKKKPHCILEPVLSSLSRKMKPKTPLPSLFSLFSERS